MNKPHVGKMGYEKFKHILAIFLLTLKKKAFVYTLLIFVSRLLYTKSLSPNLFLFCTKSEINSINKAKWRNYWSNLRYDKVNT